MRKKRLNILVWGCILFVIFKIYLQLFAFLVGYAEKQAQLYINCNFGLLEQHGELNSIIKLRKDEIFNFQFISPDNNLRGIRIQAVTWGNKQQKYLCTWVLQEIVGTSLNIINSGTFYSTDAVDWSYLSLDFGNISDSRNKTYKLNILSDCELNNCVIGIPLFEKVKEKQESELFEKVGASNTTIPSYQLLFSKNKKNDN